MQGQKVVVIGAGPVGALAALYAAQRDSTVEVYELRPDLRHPSTVPLNFTKSINLALSQRGITAIEHASHGSKLLQSVLDDTIPMHGRMIHGQENGQIFEKSQNYDAFGRFIRAADRAGLNKALLDELEKYPNVKIFFNHKLTGADFKRKLAWMEKRNANGTYSATRFPEFEIKFDLMIGADGAHSSTRQHLMKFSRMSYNQDYIDTLWCEFHMAAGADGFKISPNHLHIWPAGSFMFIAIPSMDKSFTCTLFMSVAQFEEIDMDPHGRLVPFFRRDFPGVADVLIDSADLLTQYQENPHLPLMSVKCTPYHYGSSGVIIGDAAHAMVPFYGQGMNAGLEDVRVLFETLDKHLRRDSVAASDAEAARARALDDYTRRRTPDAHTINDLAMRNYQEMRSDVLSPLYLMRKSVEEKLSVWFPRSGFITQYTRVSFSDQPYAQVWQAVDRQRRILLGTAGFILGSLSLAASWCMWTSKIWRRLS